MRTANALLFAALAAASPSPQPQTVDFGAVAAAPTVASGPAAGVSFQTAVYVQTSAVAAASAAGASQTGAAQKKKRGVFLGQTPCSTTSTTVTPTSTPCSTSAARAASTTSAVTSTSATTTTSAVPYVDSSACSTYPSGFAPTAVPDTEAGFLAYAPYHASASAAATPSGYTLSFQNLNASVSQASYLGVRTLQSYDTIGCATICDNTTTCTAFNVYIERDPVVDPAANCSNPASTSNYFCTLWGSSINSTTATNAGQYRSSFHVLITASNGYDKTPIAIAPSCSGWQPPKKCGSSGEGSVAHSHSATTMGSHFFPGPYDPTQCAAYATAENWRYAGGSSSMLWWYSMFQTTSNCKFFNAYMLKRDGAATGTMCVLFAASYAPSQAAYMPGWYNGHYYSIESSWSYSSS